MNADRRFRFLYFVFFASYSGIVAFRNVYFKELGMTGFQMGLIGSLWVVGGIIAQPIWGGFTDYTGSPSRVLIVAAVLSSVSVLFYPLGSMTSVTFLIIVVGTVFFSMTRAPIVPIVNSLVLQRGYDYGQLRSFGSIAFGIGVFLIGFILSTVGTVFIVFIYVAGIMVFVGLTVGVPVGEKQPLGGSLRTEAFDLFRQPQFALVLVVAFLVGAVSTSGSAFFSVYMRAIDLGDSLTGIAWAIKTFAEAVIFLSVADIDLTYSRKLAGGGLLYAVAFALFSVSTSTVIVLGANLLLGAGLALVYYSLVNVVHRYAPEALQSTAQTVLMGVGIGTGGAVGQIFAGYLVDLVGTQQMYAFLSVIAVAFAGLSLFVHPIESEDARGTCPE